MLRGARVIAIPIYAFPKALPVGLLILVLWIIGKWRMRQANKSIDRWVERKRMRSSRMKCENTSYLTDLGRREMMEGKPQRAEWFTGVPGE